jgi:hypothetical protein
MGLSLPVNDDGARWQFQTQKLGTHCISMAMACLATERVAVDVLETFALAR